MLYSVDEVLQFVEENDVKFIRLAFCDILGVQKNISIMPGVLARAFADGMMFDASSVKGFMNAKDSDLFLHPDPSTLSTLPWRPSHGRVVRLYCDIRHPDGRSFEGDTRNLLKQAVADAREMGYSCKIGSECEFYLFRTDEDGFPTMHPHDYAGYCDIAPNDRGENVRREICLTLEDMGILPESSCHESGPGQNEIDFRYADALTAADQLMTFRSVVKAIAAQNGLYATFMPKPMAEQSGNGMHINLSLAKDGFNIFKSGQTEHSQVAESFIAGIMDKIADMTLFLNPLTNSYARFGEYDAPKYISWSHQNRSQLIRIPAAKRDEFNRMELRSPDPSCNPYLAFALLLFAGLEGIRAQLPLAPATNLDLSEAGITMPGDVKPLPATLEEAIQAAVESPFIQAHLPAQLLERFVAIKRAEWERYQAADDKPAFDRKTYFYKI